MTYDPEIHHRRSIRLKAYDYTSAGAYFVTIRAADRLNPFGEITDGLMHPNAAGQMIETVWHDLPRHYPGIDLDAFIVMPNHVHGIIILTTDVDLETAHPVGATPRGCPVPMPQHSIEPTPPRDANDPAPPRDANDPAPPRDAGTGKPRGMGTGQPRGVAPTMAAPLSLPDVVHRFKSLTTNRYTDGVTRHDWPPFPGRLWQRNYYEHVVRDEPDLDRIRAYIDGNPARWLDDPDHPQFVGAVPRACPASHGDAR